MKTKLRRVLRYGAALLVAVSILAPMGWLFLMSCQFCQRSLPRAAGVAASSVGFQPLSGADFAGTESARQRFSCTRWATVCW
jgi:hypothetical protein